MKELKPTSQYVTSIGMIADDSERGIWEQDDRKDRFEILDSRILIHLLSITLVCKETAFHSIGCGEIELNVLPLGELFELHEDEAFRYQPSIATDVVCTGFLVAPDIICTSGHYANESNVKDLRFIFDYNAVDPVTVTTRFSKTDVYRGIEIVKRTVDFRGPLGTYSDWALVKIHRPVFDRPVLKFSQRPVFQEEPIYMLSHQLGLPLKYGSGYVTGNIEKSYFWAAVDAFTGASGAPVFSMLTNEIHGILAQADCQDFFNTNTGVKSIAYPDDRFKSEGARIIKAAEFKDCI